MIKSYKASFFIASVFLLALVILILFASSTTRFFSMEFRQASSDQLFSIYENNSISQTFSQLDIDAIQFAPKINNLLAALQDPLYVEVFFHNSGYSFQHKCSTYQVFFSQKCKIYVLSLSAEDDNPVTFTFYSDASEGVHSIWGTHKEVMSDGGLRIAGESVNGGLEFYGFNLGPPEMRVFSVFQNFLTLSWMTFYSFVAGIGVTLLLQKNKHSRSEFVIIAIFFGVAISILFVLLFSLINLPFKFLPFLFGILLFINIIIAIISGIKQSQKINFLGIQPNEIWLIILFLFASLVSSVQISNVVSPLWVDGLFHHELIENIIITNNVFNVNVYPTGFHALAIAQHYLFPLKITESILMTGQWLVVLSGLSFFMLANKLSTMKISSWIGTVVYLFISPFPNYLINWSRYPFLFGLVLLPVALFFFMVLMEDSKYLWVVIIWVFLVSVTHYSVFLLLVAGAIAIVCVYSPRGAFSIKSLSSKKLFTGLLFILVLGGGYLFYQFLSLIHSDNFTSILDQTRIISENTDYIYSFGLILQNFGWLIYFLAIFGCIVLNKVNKKLLMYLCLWILFAISMIFFQKLVIGVSVLTLVNLFYFLSIPMCLSTGIGVAYAYQKMGSRLCSTANQNENSCYVQNFEKISLVILLVCFLLAGYQQSAMVNPKVVMVTPDDIKAYQWIDSNITSEAKFLINSFEWGYEYKPVDGGGWINAFTHRHVFFLSGGVGSNSMKEFINENNIEYVYLGQGSREISSNWFDDECLVYQEGYIKIYWVNHLSCFQ